MSPDSKLVKNLTIITTAIMGTVSGAYGYDASQNIIPIDCEPMTEVLTSVETAFDTGKKRNGFLQYQELSALDKKNIKGCEITKRLKSLDVQEKTVKINDSTLTIELVGTEYIDGGLEVYARAWDGKKQIGFGDDGTVDIERFRIINPPVLVEDPTGPIVRTSYDEIEAATITKRYREDPIEATLQSLAHTIKVKNEKSANSNRIVNGRVGNTTTTVYPEPSTGTAPVDALLTYDHCASGDCDEPFSTFFSETEATSVNNTIAVTARVALLSRNFGYRYLRRGVAGFDTSAIGSDTISSATLSFYVQTKLAELGGQDIGVTGFTPDSESAIAVGDWDSHDSTRRATDVAQSSITTSQLNDWTLNASGLAYINTSGNTFFVLRGEWDIDETFGGSFSANKYDGIDIRMADQTGTTDDPKLVVEHSGASRRIINTTVQ